MLLDGLAESKCSGYPGVCGLPSTWSWELKYPKRPGTLEVSQISEAGDWNVLAPKLKRLRLTEASQHYPSDCDMESVEPADVFLCSPGTELGRDVNVQMSSANCWPSVGTASAGGTTTSLRTCQDAGAAKGSGASQEWRAQIHQRALEEMRRYRQALRNCEVGVTVRQCG
ncbi:unnamed protein product [Effrenium voratum]|uniref:Uncharacterized protein n=1 Tax=Effrenium voratum TaxID=2562239 RepID=A0AA36I7W2_9DINO|nr:unnamed protein product [Effrenium voratum]CAJ1431916.1 unnamed protein product [Effrenium voratum]